MRLIREAEEAICREYPTNDLKTPCHLAIGAEAIAVGVCETFPGCQIFASYRNHHWYLASGGDLENFFLELYGKKNPIADGKAGSMHLSSPETGLMLTSAVVATQIGPALGNAFAMKYRGNRTLTVAALGDGAMEEGVFSEALNLASLYRLPVLFVVEDNGLAIHSHKHTRQAFELRSLAAAYEIPYFSGLGLGLKSVMDTLREITSFPAIAHFHYHRFKEHVGPSEDYDAGYREKPECLDLYDPLHGIEPDSEIKSLVTQAIEKARKAPLAPKQALLEHIFSP